MPGCVEFLEECLAFGKERPMKYLNLEKGANFSRLTIILPAHVNPKAILSKVSRCCKIDRGESGPATLCEHCIFQEITWFSFH